MEIGFFFFLLTEQHFIPFCHLSSNDDDNHRTLYSEDLLIHATLQSCDSSTKHEIMQIQVKSSSSCSHQTSEWETKENEICDSDMVVSAKWAGLSILETADLIQSSV